MLLIPGLFRPSHLSLNISKSRHSASSLCLSASKKEFLGPDHLLSLSIYKEHCRKNKTPPPLDSSLISNGSRKVMGIITLVSDTRKSIFYMPSNDQAHSNMFHGIKNSSLSSPFPIMKIHIDFMAE